MLQGITWLMWQQCTVGLAGKKRIEGSVTAELRRKWGDISHQSAESSGIREDPANGGFFSVCSCETTTSLIASLLQTLSKK